MATTTDYKEIIFQFSIKSVIEDNIEMIQPYQPEELMNPMGDTEDGENEVFLSIPYNGEIFRQNSGEASAPLHKFHRQFFAGDEWIPVGAVPKRQRAALAPLVISSLSEEDDNDAGEPALGETFKPDSWTRVPKNTTPTKKE